MSDFSWKQSWAEYEAERATRVIPAGRRALEIMREVLEEEKKAAASKPAAED